MTDTLSNLTPDDIKTSANLHPIVYNYDESFLYLQKESIMSNFSLKAIFWYDSR